MRYADTDKMGYVYNGNYLMLFEIGRTELLREIGFAYAEFERTHDVLLPVIESRVFYKLPAFYDDMLTIETTYEHSLGASLTMNYRILRGDDVIALGYTVHLFVQGTSRKPIRPPKVFTEHIERFVSHIK